MPWIKTGNPSMLRRASAGLGLIAALLAPRHAVACYPTGPSFRVLAPSYGATYPANAALEVSESGPGDLLTEVHVDVAGEARSLAYVQNIAGPVLEQFGVGGALVLIVPPPSPGQTVTLSGDLCWDNADGYTCTASVAFSYIAGPDDTTAPVTADRIEVDLQSVDSGDSCLSTGGRWYFDIPGIEGATAQESVNYLKISESPNGAANPGYPYLVKVDPTRTWQSVGVNVIDVDGDRHTFDDCLDITPTDAAGNDGRTYHTCEPCYFPHSFELVGHGVIPAEPARDAADWNQGGTCLTDDPPQKSPIDAGLDAGTHAGLDASLDAALDAGSWPDPSVDTSDASSPRSDQGCSLRSMASADSHDTGKFSMLGLAIAALGVLARSRRRKA